MTHSNYEYPLDRIECLDAASNNPPTASIEPRNLDEAMQRGRRLRAQAMQNFSATVRGSLAVALQQLIGRYRHWREVRQAEDELRALSPQMLRDIGIHRSQIPAVARGLDSRPKRQPARVASVQQLQPKALPADECCVDEAA